MIELHDVRRAYGPKGRASEVLRGVDLTLADGELLALTGRSGSGKTTLLNIMGGLDSEYSGTVRVGGVDLRTLSDNQLSDYRNRRVGFVFQAFHLIEHLACVENVSLPARFARGDHSPSRSAARERAMALLARMELEHRALSPPSELSGGERQRIAIARALFNHPAVLLCDEPTGNLDVETAAPILSLFRDLNRTERITIVLVTHDTEVASTAHRVMRVTNGRLEADRNPCASEATT